MLLYFILGIIFISIIIPLLENLESLLSSYTEYLVYIIAYKITLLKTKIKAQQLKIQEEEDQFEIGFHHTEAKGFEIKNNDDNIEEE